MKEEAIEGKTFFLRPVYRIADTGIIFHNHALEAAWNARAAFFLLAQ